MSDASDLVVRVTRWFPHEPETVFAGWLDPATVRRFLFTAGEDPLRRCDIDAREGGTFIMTDRRPEGDVEHHGRYLEIDRPRRLVFSYGVPSVAADQDVVTLVFTGTDGGCAVTLVTRMQPEWVGYVEAARSAWTTMLDGLAAILG